MTIPLKRVLTLAVPKVTTLPDLTAMLAKFLAEGVILLSNLQIKARALLLCIGIRILMSAYDSLKHQILQTLKQRHY